MSNRIVVILCAAAALVGVGLLLTKYAPQDFRVEHSVRIAAPPALVFARLDDLHRWQSWSPWGSQADATAQPTYSGPPAGIDSASTWNGDEAGEGSVHIDVSRPPERLEVTFDFVRPVEVSADGLFTVASQLDPNQKVPQSLGTWRMHGVLSTPVRWWSYLFPMERLLSPKMQQGLQSLRQQCDEEVKALVPVHIPGTPGAPALSVLRDDNNGCGWWRVQGEGKESLGHFEVPCKAVVSLTINREQDRALALLNAPVGPQVSDIQLSDNTVQNLPTLPMRKNETALAAQFSGNAEAPSLVTWAPAPPEDQPGTITVGKWRRYRFVGKGWQLSNTMVEDEASLRSHMAGAAQANFYQKDAFVRQVNVEDALKRGAAIKTVPAQLCGKPKPELMSIEQEVGTLMLCVESPNEGFLHTTGEGAFLPKGQNLPRAFKLPDMGRSLLRFWNFHVDGTYAMACKHGAHVWNVQTGERLTTPGDGTVASLWPYDMCQE